VTAPDYFALLDEPRRPWLDPESLKKKFLALSANSHPDKVHSASESEKINASKRFTELNAAYNCLATPKSRLLHLLEIERGAKPKDVQQIPGGLADLFAEVATICRAADGFISEKAKAVSPLLQVKFFERAQEWIEKLNAVRAKLSELSERLFAELTLLDAKWMAADPRARGRLLDDLEELYRLFSYFNRWGGQIQERIVQLSL
jgi:hypothetical protein